MEASEDEVSAHAALRALPESDREDGDPFAPHLQDRQRAARLEGRKFKWSDRHTTSQGAFYVERLVKIEVFRRFLPGRGGDGKGLVQAYGMSAKRVRPAEDRTQPQVPMKPGSPHLMYPPSSEPWGEWEVSGPKLLTIEVSDLRTKK